MKIMKKDTNRNLKGHHTNGNGEHLVRIEFIHSATSAVGIAGTFNDWRPEATPMVPMGQGRWLKELVLPPGKYEYLFVVNGRWVLDPLAEATVPNPFGGANSVLNVPRRRSPNGKDKGSN